MIDKENEEQKKEVFDYLDALRESGATNMFGAGPYLVSAFSFDKKEAREWLKYWMDEF